MTCIHADDVKGKWTMTASVTGSFACSGQCLQLPPAVGSRIQCGRQLRARIRNQSPKHHHTVQSFSCFCHHHGYYSVALCACFECHVRKLTAVAAVTGRCHVQSIP